MSTTASVLCRTHASPVKFESNSSAWTDTKFPPAPLAIDVASFGAEQCGDILAQWQSETVYYPGRHCILLSGDHINLLGDATLISQTSLFQILHRSRCRITVSLRRRLLLLDENGSLLFPKRLSSTFRAAFLAADTCLLP